MPDTTEALITGLRAWVKTHDLHVRAAVELLIWHGGGGFWLRRQDFVRVAVIKRGGEAWIDWRKAREFVSAGPKASTSEMAILDLAVALGEDRYRFSIMGTAHSKAIADAVRQAVGCDG
jgi:hypothetical protein